MKRAYFTHHLAGILRKGRLPEKREGGTNGFSLATTRRGKENIIFPVVRSRICLHCQQEEKGRELIEEISKDGRCQISENTEYDRYIWKEKGEVT